MGSAVIDHDMGTGKTKAIFVQWHGKRFEARDDEIWCLKCQEPAKIELKNFDPNQARALCRTCNIQKQLRDRLDALARYERQFLAQLDEHSPPEVPGLWKTRTTFKAFVEALREVANADPYCMLFPPRE